MSQLNKNWVDEKRGKVISVSFEYKIFFKCICQIAVIQAQWSFMPQV